MFLTNKLSFDQPRYIMYPVKYANGKLRNTDKYTQISQLIKPTIARIDKKIHR